MEYENQILHGLERDSKKGLKAKTRNSLLFYAYKKLHQGQKCWTKKKIAASLGISFSLYERIEALKQSPSRHVQDSIIDFYSEHGIELSREELFFHDLKKSFHKKHSLEMEIDDIFIPLSSLDEGFLVYDGIWELDAEQKDLQEAIKMALNSLPKRGIKAKGIFMADILKMYFGLPPYEEPIRETEIANRYGVARQHVSHIKQEGLEILRRNPQIKDLKIFLGGN